MKYLRSIFLLVSLFCITAVAAEQTMELKSADFVHNGKLPSVLTCDGDDVSPALSWSNVPENTKSLVLIVDDPDTPDPNKPEMTWVHWLLYNIPATVSELPRAVAINALPVGTQQGKNDWKKTGYRGACPPIGRHRYFHKLYALDIVLPDLDLPNKAQLETAMAGHIIGRAQLVATYYQH